MIRLVSAGTCIVALTLEGMAVMLHPLQGSSIRQRPLAISIEFGCSMKMARDCLAVAYAAYSWTRIDGRVFVVLRQPLAFAKRYADFSRDDAIAPTAFRPV